MSERTTIKTRKTPNQFGFHKMDKAKQREIASMGGKAAQKDGKGFDFRNMTPEQRREAGRKGAAVVAARGTRYKLTEADRKKGQAFAKHASKISAERNRGFKHLATQSPD